MRYTQDFNMLIKGPGLPESGAVAIGPAELEAAYQAGRLDGTIVVDSGESFDMEIPKDHPEYARMISIGWRPKSPGSAEFESKDQKSEGND